MESHKPNCDQDNERDIKKPQSRYSSEDEAHRYGRDIEYFDYERQTQPQELFFSHLIPKTQLFPDGEFTPPRRRVSSTAQDASK
jgi:hypothetical protein